jgi:hypothetical protein
MLSDPADPTFFHLDDDALEPSGVRLVCDNDGRVVGLRCERLVHMVRAEGAAGWV